MSASIVDRLRHSACTAEVTAKESAFQAVSAFASGLICIMCVAPSVATGASIVY